jgi:GDP-L-fucose synthase
MDDMAQAVVFALKTLPDYLYNVGTGEDLTIKHWLKPSKKGHKGEIIWDVQTRWYTRKLMDISKMHALGWKHQVQLKKEYRKPILVLDNIKSFKQEIKCIVNK